MLDGYRTSELLWRLVQKILSQGGKARSRAKGIQNFPGDHATMPPKWLVASPLNGHPPTFDSGYATVYDTQKFSSPNAFPALEVV